MNEHAQQMRPGLRPILRAAVKRSRREGKNLYLIEVEDLDALLVEFEHVGDLESRLVEAHSLLREVVEMEPPVIAIVNGNLNNRIRHTLENLEESVQKRSKE